MRKKDVGSCSIIAVNRSLCSFRTLIDNFPNDVFLVFQLMRTNVVSRLVSGVCRSGGFLVGVLGGEEVPAWVRGSLLGGE